MRPDSETVKFTNWLDDRSQFGSGLDPNEERLFHILENARHGSTSALSAKPEVAPELVPSAEFAKSLLDRLRILADTGGVFVPETKLAAAMRVREALPIRLPETGVAYGVADRPDDFGRAQCGRARHPVVLIAAAFLLIGAIAVPIVQRLVTGISLNRNTLVVAAGADAARRTGETWIAIKAGDHIAAGELIRSGKERLTLRLADDSIVRMDTSTYGTLSLHSKDPTIEVGDGRVYVEVNSSGAVNVLVDGVVIASHGPGSSYSVDAKGIVTVTKGSGKVTALAGNATEIHEGTHFDIDTFTQAPRQPASTMNSTDSESDSSGEAEWIKWNRAGGRSTR